MLQIATKFEFDCRYILLLLLFPAPALAQSAEQKQATIKYLKSLQQSDGGFLASPAQADEKARSSLRATSAACRAIQYWGGELTGRAAAAKFVKSCFDEKTGGFGDFPGGKPDVSLTAVGLMAVVETGLPTKEYAAQGIEYLKTHAQGFEDYRIAAAGFEAMKEFPPVMKEWWKEVAKLRNDDGSYGKGAGQARMTGSAAALILRSGGKLGDQDRKGALEAILSGQRADGGFGKEGVEGSDLETTYRVLRALHHLGAQPRDEPKLRAFLARCRNADGGYGVEAGKQSNAAGCYFAGIILYWLGQNR